MAVIMDCRDMKLDELRFDNRPSGFPELLKLVKKHTRRGQIPISGMEDVGGFGCSFAVFLKEKDCIVKEVNPTRSSDKRRTRTKVAISMRIENKGIVEICQRFIRNEFSLEEFQSRLETARFPSEIEGKSTEY